ncbi:MORN repeat-containing protein [Gracilibacillus massiliensis]|uniref:MORN repeat-containing protein n=1 Tax=Gracilibacillus massiliensis TaxID=1564956 RepID=UPI0009EA2E90|nr:MORN repeat-containing protein [Gracilibacillus massiliensis]
MERWLWYEGEFKNDKPHGYGKMYDQSGQLRYEGQLEEMQYVGLGYFKSQLF